MNRYFIVRDLRTHEYYGSFDNIDAAIDFVQAHPEVRLSISPRLETL